jgi:peptidoglycan hydrolase-like protein with peptidoglycan-binding domain
MTNWKAIAIVLAVVLLTVAAVAQQRKNAASEPDGLSASDYVQIQQLVNRYADAIDNCTNNGADYAALYTPDGYFAPSMNGRVGTKFQGPDRLAEAAGGGVKGCKDKLAVPPEMRSRHVYVNLVITPTAEGATGSVDLLVAGKGGNRNYMEIQGHYEDVYARTPAGWRFASRVHVVPADFRRQ